MERGIYRNAQYSPSQAADNATATSTLAASSGMAHLIFGIHAQYSGAVASKKAITLQYTNESGTDVTMTWEVDFNLSRGQDILFPLPIRGKPGDDVVVTLAASGSGGTTGIVGPYWTCV